MMGSKSKLLLLALGLYRFYLSNGFAWSRKPTAGPWDWGVEAQ
jgi:hypothetical protein